MLDMLARANSVCLPALSRSDRRVLSLLTVERVDCVVLHGAVLAVLAVQGGSRYLTMLGDNMLVYTRTWYVQNKVQQKNKRYRIGEEDSSSNAELSMK